MAPQRKKKYFTITQVEFDEDGNVELCIIQAIMTKTETAIHWRDLKNREQWKQGWN